MAKVEKKMHFKCGKGVDRLANINPKNLKDIRSSIWLVKWGNHEVPCVILPKTEG